VEQELLTLPEHHEFTPVFIRVRVTRSLVVCVCFVDRCFSFCIFFFWPLCCLFFFDIRILITPLVSSNSPYILGAGQAQQKYNYFYFNCKPQSHLRAP
jgi:hypothetical protein